ncbi:hypothetical protein [Brevibacillus sp. FSL K6-2834]|uniref:hypothetical protein n=1 Tax=Brevibacillus sp. FSL K6-2834 TaxID=2954680 RepID=UPI0031591362
MEISKYNGFEVVCMTKIESILKSIMELTETEKRELFFRLYSELEEMGFLKLSESSLAEWNSKEDDIYNEL